MGEYTIYAILGILVLVYLFITFTSKRSSNQRKDRKFMDDYKRRDKNSER